MGLKKIADEFRNATEKQFWPYIADSDKTDVKELQKQLQVTDKSVAYVYELNWSGKIVCIVNGKFTDEKLEHLEDVVE